MIILSKAQADIIIHALVDAATDVERGQAYDIMYSAIKAEAAIDADRGNA